MSPRAMAAHVLGRERAAPNSLLVDGLESVHGATARNVRRSIANLDSTKLPAISIPVALPNQTAGRLFDVDRLRRIINRRRRGSWPCCQSAAEQRPADKSAHYAGGDLTVLGACRHRQQKRTREQCNSHDS